MVQGKRITTQGVESFIRKVLPGRIKADFQHVKIVKEADIETCCYYHLRRYLRGDPRWSVLARKHARLTGRYIDLLLFRKTYPTIAIELKWQEPGIPQKDRKSLLRAIRRLRVRKAYFLSVLFDVSKYEKRPKPLDAKYKFFEIPVGLDSRHDPSGKIEALKQEVKKYKSGMRRGKA